AILTIDQKVRVAAKGIEIESAISSSMMSKDTFAGVKSILASGGRPEGLIVTGPNGEGFAEVGRTVRLNADGTPCSAADCEVEVDLDIRCASATSCSAAYNI